MIGDLFRAARRYLSIMALTGKKRRTRTQYAALPYRRGPEGLEVMLITSRETRRWVIPKGWPMKGKKPHEAARQEALEEAGLVGRVSKNAAGRYEYEKRLRTGALVPCKVEVFPLRVEKQRERWREQGQREARWFSPEGAAGAVAEPGLAEIVLRFQERRARKASSKVPAGKRPPEETPPERAAGEPAMADQR